MAVFTAQLKAFDPGDPTICDACQTEFSLISVHNKVVHSGQKENRCAFCGMPFTSRKRLLDHLDVHSDGSDLFCCVCLRGQKSDDALSEHLETHRELHVFLCGKCRRTFASKSGLSGHDCLPKVLDVEDGKHISSTVSTGSVDVSEDKTDENGVRVPEEQSGPSQNCGTPLLPNALRNLTSVGDSGAFKVSVKDHLVMKIGQRQLRLTESTFSENLAPRVLSSETCIDPVPCSNRDGEVHPLSGSTVVKEENVKIDDLIEITGIKLEIGGPGKVVAVKLESDQRLEKDSTNVDVPNTVIVHCIGAGQSGEFGVVSAGATSPAQHGITRVVMPETPPDSGGTVSPQTDAACVALPVSLDAPACLADPGGNSNLAQSPSTAISADTTSPCTCDAELPQPAALPPDLETEEKLLEESCANPSTPIHIKAEETATELESGDSRSSLKRSYAAAIESTGKEENVSRSKAQTLVGDSAELGGSAGPTPPDSPAPAKKKRISFNEQIEFWNPILQERAWLAITEEFPEVREVPLLETSKYKRVCRTRKKKKGSKPTKMQEILSAVFGADGSARSASPPDDPEKPDEVSNTEVVSSNGLSTPPPQELRPVLKPSPQVAPAEPKVKTRGGRLPKHSKELFKLFGPNFRYNKCLKVDGRFHCPDNDCCNNNDRGFATDKGLRHHIWQNHLRGIMLRKKKKGSKPTKIQAILSAVFGEDGSAKSAAPPDDPEKPDEASNTEVVSSNGLSTPPPQELRPILKPSPQVAPAEPKVKTRGGRLPKHSKELFKLFGPNFRYNKCLKADGRFHCPDNDCCNNNNQGFATDKGLRHHIRQNHLQEIIFHQCPQCKKTFPGRCKLAQHMEIHNAPDAYSCPVCDKKFKTLASVKQHKGVHNMVFQCYHCQLKFSKKVSLKAHARTSVCKCCNVVLRCAELFRRHELKTPHYYRCTSCNKHLTTLQRFNWHIRNFHYNKSTALDGTWICHVCERKFTTRHIALRHARLNHTLGPEMEPNESIDNNAI